MWKLGRELRSTRVKLNISGQGLGKCPYDLGSAPFLLGSLDHACCVQLWAQSTRCLKDAEVGIGGGGMKQPSSLFRADLRQAEADGGFPNWVTCKQSHDGLDFIWISSTIQLPQHHPSPVRSLLKMSIQLRRRVISVYKGQWISRPDQIPG
jgi:hypothetical protein